MTGLNRAYLIGTVRGDVDLRTTAGGTSVAVVSLCVPAVTMIDGERVSMPEYHRLTAAGDVAAHLHDVAAPGASIAVECAIRSSKWTDRDGAIHFETALVITSILWCKRVHA